MNEEIYRKKSVESIKSPESLDDYIKVANPGVWLALGAVTIFLVGIFVWGYFGRLETRLPVTVTVSDGVAVCTAEQGDLSTVEPGMPLKTEEAEGTVREVFLEEHYATATLAAADGVYDAFIVTESLQPLSLLMN